VHKIRPLHQRYAREFWPAMAAYVAVMLLLWPLLPQVHSEWLKIVLALLPVIPVLFAVCAMVRLVLRSDELEQRIHLIGLAVAATVVSTLSLAGGFLSAANVIKLDGSILLWVWPALVLLYSAGRSWASRRYGGDGNVICNDGFAWHWRLWLLALAMAGVAWLGRSQLAGYQLGVLSCMSAALAAGGLILAIAHWRRRDDQEAP
jgi:hypothetical protein